MTYKLNVGRHQIAFRLQRKPGRPKKPVYSPTKDFLFLLVKIARDRRYTGNPVSRVLRRIFENKKMGKIFGANLAIFTLLTSTAAPSISAFSTDSTNTTTAQNPTVIKITTENSVRPPLDSFIISQGYHYFHPAIDFKDQRGAPVYAITGGEVEIVVHKHYGYGNHLIINHGSGFKSLYAHLDKIITQQGEIVNKGTVIGTVGSTGRATGTHLHLEVYDHGQPFNPLIILQ